jgi:dihydroneopterin aldolase/2-amino-4-hydroxy-6-hydroxymethyldihydropteridine diphosphokinase
VTLPRPTDAAGRPLDQVRLTGLRVRGHHGVFPEERREGQDFVVDVVLHLDVRAAAATDDLTRTVHYGELAVALATVVRGEPVDLLETLATRLARTCCADRRVQAADVTVHKPQAPIPEDFADVSVTVRRTRAELGPDVLAVAPDGEARAVLALGANLGDRLATLRAAVAELAERPGVRVRAVSPVVETDPVGGPDQPDYLNAVVLVTTSLSPLDLLAACQAVEAAHGRRRDVRWGPRTLDVDVVAYDALVASSEVLELPHPRAAVRAFVLAPWVAADPLASLPVPVPGRPGEIVPRPVADLLAEAPDRDGVRPRPDLGPLDPDLPGAQGEEAP